MIFWTPAFFIVPKPEAWKIAKMWAYSHLWLQHKICGSTYEFRGLENLDPHANQLVASKHQSAWETYTMILFFKDPGYILKRELMYIPLFGWYMAKMKVVPVDRGKGALALASMANNARQYMIEHNRQIIIYPEGTRTTPGAETRYKYGLTYLYNDLKVPVQPVALNSGLYWGRRAPDIFPGKIIMEFLPKIAPGMEEGDFSRHVREVIESASNRLYGEAASGEHAPPLARELAVRKS